MIDIRALVNADKGRLVEYHGMGGEVERGTINSWNSEHIWVRYGQNPTGTATTPELLEFVADNAPAVELRDDAGETVFALPGRTADGRSLPPISKAELTHRVSAALAIAQRYGGIDGTHHKEWVIDQMVRCMTGEFYDVWVACQKRGKDGANTYPWPTGIAP